MRMRIGMLLRNPFTRDARVLREARTLARAGHDVIVLAVQGSGLPKREERDGFTIVRAIAGGPLAGPTIAGAGGHAMRSLPRPAAAVWIRDVLLARTYARPARSYPDEGQHSQD